MARRWLLAAFLAEALAAPSCRRWPWDQACDGRGECTRAGCVCDGARSGEFCEDLAPAFSSPCPQLSPRPSLPERADDVRPDEVSVVMAMGDSMTAGFNLKKPWMKEHRGWSFSAGGEPSAVTLATLLKAYNPEVIGPSMGIRDITQQIGKAAAPCAAKDYAVCGLNAAVDGSRVSWLPSQLTWLEQRLGELRPGNWKNEWKMLTILSGLDDIVFGPNNFLNTTNRNEPAFATPVADVEQGFDTLLAELHSRFPRLLVNILALPEDLETAETLHSGQCKFTNFVFSHTGVKWTNRSEWHDHIVKYNRALVRVVKRWQDKACTTRSCEMQVALRLTFAKTPINRTGLDPIDCFHPNLRLSEAMAISLWNEMLNGVPPQQADPWTIRWAQNATCLLPHQRFTAPAPDGSYPTASYYGDYGYGRGYGGYHKSGYYGHGYGGYDGYSYGGYDTLPKTLPIVV
eukprot:TRINITY_DN53224_c0_g1_i1.p1 TRINITY_DN53224_c0_g1~~TRINITY_DN53224_c0_g1_i1.p1  ORF type:complete len:470 (-),score=83.81 TRINITY_DN53224_c0_g1_i1:114-1487(-)